MSIRTALLVFAAPALLLLASAPSVSVAQDKTTSGTAAINARGTVTIDNHEGRITVKTWDRSEVKYEAVVRAQSGADHPEATVVRVDRSENRFAIRTDCDESKEDGDDGGFFSSSQNMMPVEYTLTVPRSVRVDIEDHESDIQVQNVKGEVSIETHDGTIALTDQGGDADLDSHDGPVRVENLAGTLTIETHDSDVRLRSISGPVEIHTHDSEIEAEGLRGGLEVDTHDGDGRFTFAELTEDLEISTHDADFTLTLPEGTGFDLQTNFDEDADLRADFDLSPYRLSSGEDDDEVNYSGNINGGGPRISLTAHEGSFEIRTQ